jgi:hypothetical protein
MIKRNRLDSQKLSEEVRKQKLSRLVSDFNKRDEPKKMYIDDKKMLLDTYKNYGSNIKKIIEKRANENMLRREKYKEEAPNNVQYAISEQGKEAFIKEKQLVEKILSKLKTNNDHFIVEDSINLKLSIFNNLHVFNLTQLKSIEKDIRAIINYSERSTVDINSSVLIVDEMTNIKKILDKYIEKYSYLHTQDQKLEYINELLKLRHTEIIDELQEEIPDEFNDEYEDETGTFRPDYEGFTSAYEDSYNPYSTTFVSPDFGRMSHFDRHQGEYTGYADYIARTDDNRRHGVIDPTTSTPSRIDESRVKNILEYLSPQGKSIETEQVYEPYDTTQSNFIIPKQRESLINIYEDEDEYGKVEEEEQEYKGEETPAVAIPAVARNMEADIIAEIRHKYPTAPKILTNPPKNVKHSNKNLKEFEHVILYDTDKPKVNGQYPVYNRRNVKKTVRLLREQIYQEFKK